MARQAAIITLVCSGMGIGCAPLLGGLEEGTTSASSADAGRDAPSIDGSAHDPRCDSWLGGFRYRMPLVVKHDGPAITGYQARITLPTSALVASGKMRGDGADLRVTAADGITVLPHWIEGGIGTEATTLWTRVDLAEGSSAAWLYYGNDRAPDRSSSSSTFASGIIDDPFFDRQDAWYRARSEASPELPSRTNEWSATLGGGKATVRLVRGAAQEAGLAGICQTMLFPDGSSYRLALDLNITLADHGSARLSFDGLGGASLWSTPTGEIGLLQNKETPDLAPGTRTICLAVNVEGDPVGQGAEATFSALRVRRTTEPEPIVEPQGGEEVGCP